MRDLAGFIGEFRGGFQRTDRYECNIFVPPKLVQAILTAVGSNGILNGLESAVDNLFSMPLIMQWLARGMLVEATRIPGRGYDPMQLSMYGITEQFPVHTTYAALQCQFLMPLVTPTKLIGHDAAVPRFFNFWQNFIQNIQNGPESGMDFKFPRDYYGTVYLSLLDDANLPSLTYKFVNVYPVTVESSEVAWQGNNSFMALPVTFQYSYWQIVPRGSVESLITGIANTIGI